jgi:cysteine-rich repeat protein
MAKTNYLRALGLGVLWATGVVQSAGAAGWSRSAEAPMVTVGKAPRLHRDVAWVQHGALDRAGFSGWTAIYDQDTGVPLRMWGPGQPARGTMASPAVAEAWARAFLAAHLDVLAPGATPSDFVVVANQLSPGGDVRSIGFTQHVNRVAVLGGAISFVFKNDRMIMVGSTALPHVATAPLVQPGLRGARLAATRVTSAAVAWLGAAGLHVVARGAVANDQVIVPLVHARGAGGVDVDYTLAEQVTVESTTGEPGQWNVYIDAATGVAFARESTLMFASGTVLYDVPVRAPMAVGGRHPQPAAEATLNVNGVAVTTGEDGVVTWIGTGPAMVFPGLSGPLVAVTDLGGAPVMNALPLPADGSVLWSRPSDEAIDAQFDAFVYANQAKQFARTRMNLTLAYLDQQLPVFVNEVNGTARCNAYSKGDELHFYPQTPGQCENTGRVADVVYHEFGHTLHRHSIIPGVGQFNHSMSEGAADTFAVTMTGDSGVGRGFYLNNTPVRELAPTQQKIWPRDADGEIHDEGEIYGETMWDLRTNLEAAMGPVDGFTQFLKIYEGTLQRAVDIPSCFAEALVADDDDGDLANGTPHECAIIAAFAAHGLYDPTVTGSVSPPVRDDFTVSITGAAPASATCQAPSVTSATISWRLRNGRVAPLPLVATGAGGFSATLPTQPNGSVVEYNVTVTLSNGATQVFPSNTADPFYQFYVGTARKIWCAGFEDGAADWTHSATPATQDRWEVGAPAGLGGDPTSAFAGHNVLGIALTGDGTYTASTITEAVSPDIELHGETNVHLQYYRWLGVEDGYFDQATITANGYQAWANFASGVDPVNAGYNHIDREWQFQDIDVSRQVANDKITLGFSLASDAGVQLGGWNLDEVCLVAGQHACGNGLVEAGEGCDDGNTASGDGCSSTCQDELAAGPRLGTGGCGTGTRPGAATGLGVLVLGLVVRRRRRT